MLQQQRTFQQLAEPALQAICEACHGTSVWLLRHDFDKRLATVVAEYISEYANRNEQISDMGEQFPEGLGSYIWTWLRSPNPQVVQLHIDSIPIDKMEYLEYLENDVKTVAFFVVYDGDSVWGFVEVWDTRQKHDFSAEEIAAALPYIRRIEHLI